MPGVTAQGCFNPLGPIAPNVVIMLSASSCNFGNVLGRYNNVGSATAERAGQGEVGGCTRTPGGCKQHGRVWAPR